MVSASDPLPAVVIVGGGSEEVEAAAAAEAAGSLVPLPVDRAALMAVVTVATLRVCAPMSQRRVSVASGW